MVMMSLSALCNCRVPRWVQYNKQERVLPPFLMSASNRDEPEELTKNYASKQNHTMGARLGIVVLLVVLLFILNRTQPQEERGIQVAAAKGQLVAAGAAAQPGKTRHLLAAADSNATTAAWLADKELTFSMPSIWAWANLPNGAQQAAAKTIAPI